jgi:segregation and condensation protein B
MGSYAQPRLQRGSISVYWAAPESRPKRARAEETLTEQQRVEAVLLIAKEPQGARRIAELADIRDATRVRTIISELSRHYDRRGRAFQVRQVAGGYQLLTRPQFAKWIRRLQHVGTPDRLSTAALETLAVIAYRQPLGRAEIDAIRGVHSGEVLRQLMEKDLVKIAGRSEELGRPFLYATTRQFLKLFGLGSLDDLPAAGQLRRQKPSDNDTPLPPGAPGLADNGGLDSQTAELE